MKKSIKLCLFTFLTYFLIAGSVNAASLSLNKSTSTVSVGGTVKITAKISGGTSYTYSNFSISYDQDRFSFVSSSDNCNGLNCLVEGNGSVTLTFKAKSNGSGAFKASGSFEDDNSGSISGSTSVNVGATSNNAPSNKPLKTNNNLSSLTVEGYDLTPVFNKDNLEYALNLPGEVEKIKINAQTEDNTAKVTGIGEVQVTEGVNTLEIVVTAENGNKKTYILKVTVEEKDPISTKIGKKEYTVVRNKDILTKPENYEEKIITINGKEVPAFYNEITKFTLVGLKDSKGNIELYIYNEKKNEYTLYKELKFNNINFYPLESKKIPKGYKKYIVDMNGYKTNGFKISKNSLYAIVYGMDIETGNEGYYMYDLDNNTLQLYNYEHINVLFEENKLYSYIILASWGMLGLFLIIIIVLCIRNSKRKKKMRKLLNKIGSEVEEQIIDNEKVIEEVIENTVNEQDEMYDLFETKKTKKKKK